MGKSIYDLNLGPGGQSSVVSCSEGQSMEVTVVLMYSR